MGQTLSNFASVLKTFYLKPIQDQLNGGTPLLNEIEKKKAKIVSGKNITIPIKIGRNQGVGARGDRGALPTAGNQQYSETIVPMRYNYGRLEVTGPTIAAARNDKGAFIRAIESEVKGMVKDLRWDLNRQLHGDASGCLAMVNQGTPSTSLVVDNPYGATDTKGTRLFRGGAGMRLEIFSAKSGGSQRTNTAVVSAVTPSGHIVTISPLPTGTADDDYIFREGSRGIEVMGLLGIVDSYTATTTYVQTLQSIDRSSNPVWDANVLDNGGTARALTGDLIQEAFDEVDITAGEEPNLILTTHETRRKYADLLMADRRFVNYGATLDAGQGKLAYDNKPIAVDPCCTAGSMKGISTDHFAIHRMSDFDWMDKDGAILSRVSGYDAYEAVLFLYAELGCDQPNANFDIRDIEET